MSTASPSTGLSGHHVFLQLAARESAFGGVVQGIGTAMHNRIALKADNITISTSKVVPSLPIPFSGMISGESTNVGVDLGMCTKTISLSGIITEQTIEKAYPLNSIDIAGAKTALDRKSTTDTNPDTGGPYSVTSYTGTSPNELTQENNFDIVTVDMTAHEVAQLIHSYVDSSMIQRQQNLNELIILIPSYVSKYWLYHDDTIATDATRDVDSATMIPFSFSVRDFGKDGAKLDNFGVAEGSTVFPDAFSSNGDAAGLTGFIRSFSTPFVGGQPFVEFNLDFEVAFIPLG